LTEGRLATGADMKKQRKPIKSVEMALRSLAVTSHANASTIAKISEGLEFCAEKLRTYEESRRVGGKQPTKSKREARVNIMRDWSELKRLNEKWSADLLKRIEKIPNEADRLRLLIEVEKVSLLCEIAQGIAFYHECQ
jgi:hypothetical protein